MLNEIELTQVTNGVKLIPSPGETVQAALQWHRQIGGKIVVVTLDEHGLIVVKEGRVIRQPAQTVVNVVDTTGAGDCFCGSLVAFLHKSYSLEESLAFAQKAAAYSIQQKGASPSFPKLETQNLNKTKGN